MAFDAQSARWSDICNSVANQLLSVTGLDPSCLRIVASDRYQNIETVGDRALVLRYFGPEPDTDVGVGRRARPWKRLLRVYLYTRNGLDQAGTDPTALFADGGHSEFEENVVDALDEYWPKDTDGNVLTIEPLHPLNSAEGPPTRKEENETGWLISHLDFEVRYVGRTSDPIPGS